VHRAIDPGVVVSVCLRAVSGRIQTYLEDQFVPLRDDVGYENVSEQLLGRTNNDVTYKSGNRCQTGRRVHRSPCNEQSGT